MPPAAPFDFEPLTPDELAVWFKHGGAEADECEQVLAYAARARGGIDLAIAEGLHLLRRGNRLAQLGCHLDDYGREVLDLAERTTRKLAHLGGELRTRPLLREALRSGRVGLRAAETVLPVAVGEAEARWVERAALQTVRELEQAVRRESVGESDGEEDWVRLGTHLPRLDREVVDVGLAVAGFVQPGSSRVERIEAMAQELLGTIPGPDQDDDTRPLGAALRWIGRGGPVGAGGGPARRAADAARREQLERETERWCVLPTIPPVPALEAQLDELSTAAEVDARLRELAKLRASYEAAIGWCAHALRRSGIPQLLGFASFRHYVEERLGVPPRAVEQREELEERMWKSPALREARRQKVSYEKLRVLSSLPEGDLRAWIPRAQALTCIELRRRVEGERERQMRAARKLVIAMPLRVASLLAAAVHAVRERFGRALPIGKCLSTMAWHFAETWKHELEPPRSASQKVRERDLGMCQVPGCSHAAEHAHHVEYRSRGGSDDLSNQVGVCSFHHLRCIHGGTLRVTGTAPDRLRWFLCGEPWNAGAVPPPAPPPNGRAPVDVLANCR